MTQNATPNPPTCERYSASANPSPSPSPTSGPKPTSTPPAPTSAPRSTKTAQSPSPASPATSPQQAPEPIPLALIDDPPQQTNPRPLDHNHVSRLAKSISALGLLSPLVISSNGHRFTLVAGNHRLAALRQLGWTTAPAVIVTGPPERNHAAAIAENVTRADPSPVDQALALAPLVEGDPNGIEGVAQAIGKTPAWIDTRLEILTWPHTLIAAVHTRKIALAPARILAKIPNPEVREQRIQDAVNNGINARTASLWLQQAHAELAPQENASEKIHLPALQQLEVTTRVHCFCCRQLVDILATKPTNICHACMAEITKQWECTQQNPTTTPTP